MIPKHALFLLAGLALVGCDGKSPTEPPPPVPTPQRMTLGPPEPMTLTYPEAPPCGQEPNAIDRSDPQTYPPRPPCKEYPR